MILDEIKKYLSKYDGALTENNGLYVFSFQVADRKTALNNISVSYTTKFRILEDEKLVRFTEIIKESSSGLGVGGDSITPGFGFKKREL